MSAKDMFTIERLLGLPSKRDVVDLTKETRKQGVAERARYQIRYQSSSGDSTAESDKESVTSEGNRPSLIKIHNSNHN